MASDTGATRNRVPMTPSQVSDLAKAYVVAHAPNRSRRSSAAFARLSDSSIRFLHTYGGPVDVAKIGSGQWDGMVETVRGFQQRDLVPGFHVAQMAGAQIVGIGGEELRMDYLSESRTKFIAAGSRELLHSLVDLVKSPRSEK
jgi:fructose-1,6-bisphosphatase/inositol monophosphatase family enzyme